jgi:hypothetical protein
MNNPHFRWESELSESFKRNARPALWTRRSAGTWVRAQESTCSEGRADIVWGKFERGWSSSKFQRHAVLLQNPTASRLLVTLRRRSAQFEKDLIPRIGVTAPVLKKWLHALIDAQFVTVTKDGRFRATPLNTFPSIEICSFELKLNNWRRALYQATRYRSFSHRVFVVMPEDNAHVAYQHQELFSKANVGLIAHDKTGQSQVLVRPNKRSPYAGYRMIMALGMLSQSAPIRVRPSHGRS